MNMPIVDLKLFKKAKNLEKNQHLYKEKLNN